MSGNGCPVCFGIGRLLAFGLGISPVPVPCPECAGLAITPASADDHQAAEGRKPADDGEASQRGRFG